MKYYSCDLIEHGLDLGQDSINLCCRKTDNNGCFLRLVDYSKEEIDLDKFFAIKREYRNKMKSGEGIEICKNCIYLEEKDYDDEDYISSINFNQGINCNLKCVYCTLTHGEKTPSPEYDVYPMIKQIADNGYLRKGGYITIAGGEPTLNKSFSKIMKLFIENGISTIKILTNGVKYSEVIAEALSLNYTCVVISVDAGSPEMFKWIKGADLYNQVWENIGKYLQVCKDKFLVNTKYIIIPEVNDDKDEILKYFDQTERFDVGSVSFDIELTWWAENKDNIPQSLYDLVEFTIEEAKKRNLFYEPVDRVVNIVQELKKQKDIKLSFRGHDL